MSNNKGDENNTRQGRKQEVSNKPFTHMRTSKPERQRKGILLVLGNTGAIFQNNCVATILMAQITILL